MVAEEAVKIGSSVVEGYCIDRIIIFARNIELYKGSSMMPYEQEWGKWYRSKETQAVSPFVVYMMNKKWIFVEEFNNHMLRFQQVSQ